MGIGNNKSTDVSNIYFLDTMALYSAEDTFLSTPEFIGDNYQFTATFMEQPLTLLVKTKWNSKKKQNIEQSIDIILGGKTTNILCNSITGDTIYYSGEISDYAFELKQVKTDSLGTSQFIITRKLNNVVNGDTLKFISKYEEIDFSITENIIGEVNNYWEKDAKGKYILTSLKK